MAVAPEGRSHLRYRQIASLVFFVGWVNVQDANPLFILWSISV